MRSFAAGFTLGLALVIGCEAVTIYNQTPLKFRSTSTVSGPSSAVIGDMAYTGAAAYDPLVLKVPPVPAGLAKVISYALPAQVPDRASIPHKGDFYGLSIEMSVANQTLGRNSTNINVPFLNLMAALQQRGGGVNIRVGGNTQERAELVDSIPGGRILSKDYSHTVGTAGTPPITYTADLLYMMGNISTLVNVSWWLGLPFDDVQHMSLAIMDLGEQVLGARMLGFQVGNEPDLYWKSQRRPMNYAPADYRDEFGLAVAAIASNSSIPVKNNLIGPSVSGYWWPEMIWDTGFLDDYASSLKYLAVEHYPTDNCAAQFHGANPKNPQDQLDLYLNHQAGQNMVKPYLNSTTIAQAHGKPFLMFETNTASCGGFAGISNSFVATLWGLDYGLQMAFGNFSGANLHVGGQSAFYNPFTPPPTNQSHFHQWTIGPLYYSMLVMAEALGQSGTAQVVDLYPDSVYQPVYAIYEHGKPTKLVLFNYASDATGGADYMFKFSVDDGKVPGSVAVKYLLAPAVTSKANITWAGQTLGGDFASDGRLTGSLNISTVPCDQAANTCSVSVPAPGVALVFLDTRDPAADASAADGAHTFATTTLRTRTLPGGTSVPTTLDPAQLATSNGSSAKSRRPYGSTSKGRHRTNAGRRGVAVSSAVVALVAGSFIWLLS